MHRYTNGPNANVVKQSTEENLLKSAKFGSTRKVEIGKMIERRKPDLCGVVILGNLAEKMKMELSCLRQLRQLASDEINQTIMQNGLTGFYD
jgi:hypothetical protein